MIYGNSIQVDILRHGECEGGAIFRGTTDVALREKGLKKMQKATNMLLAKGERWDVIVSSPLKRCQIFAQSLANQLSVDCHIDARLREMSFGDWEGRQIDSIWAHEQALISAWSDNPEKHTPPKGESLLLVHDRLMDFDKFIQANFAGKKILLVTHGGVIRVMLTQCLGMPLSYANRIDVPYSSLSRCMYFESSMATIDNQIKTYDNQVKMYSKKLLFHNAFFSIEDDEGSGNEKIS